MQPAGEGVSFLEAAQQGMFFIDTEAAGQIRTSIAQMQDTLSRQSLLVKDLETRAMLGDLDEARGIANLDTLVAAGDPQSLKFVLWRFNLELGNLFQAVEMCTRTYEQDDAQAAQDFRRIGEG